MTTLNKLRCVCLVGAFVALDGQTLTPNHPADGTINHCRPKAGGVQIRVRKEINDWTDAEFETYKRALGALKDRGIWDELSSDHEDVFRNRWTSQAHSHDEFLPWHRRYLEKLETLVQKEANDCSLTLPYWDWSLEAGDVKASIMWGSNRFGALVSGCVQSGIAAGWQIEGSCLRRDIWSGWINHVNADDMRVKIQDPTGYTNFRDDLEWVHNAMHVFVGGFMGHMGGGRSPADPVFWAHHAFIDRTWYEWQKSNTEASSHCGACDELEYETVKDVHSAQDYTGQHDPADECVNYPASDPRICLKYQKREYYGGRRLSGTEQCKTLLAQIDNGECSVEELMRIPRVDEDICKNRDPYMGSELTLNNFMGLTDLNEDQQRAMMEARESAMKNITKLRSDFENYLLAKPPPRHAQNDLEKRLCFSCDFICTGNGRSGRSSDLALAVLSEAKTGVVSSIILHALTMLLALHSN